jgi:hypothetical protein
MKYLDKSQIVCLCYNQMIKENILEKEFSFPLYIDF